MNPKSYRRQTIYLKNEMRSWSRNKMEDRKLALRNTMVDKHMAMSRKSHLSERDAVSKDFEQKISKTTPTADEYLGKSYHRYTAWREREKERLDRRYRGLYKSYMKEYSELSLQGYAALQTPRTPRQQPKHSLPDISQTEAQLTSSQNGVETDQPNDENELETSKMSQNIGEVVTVEKLNLAGNDQVTDTDGNVKPKRLNRRASTGSVDIPAYLNLQNLSLLPQLSETASDTHQDDIDGRTGSLNTTHTPDETEFDTATRGITPIDEIEAQTPITARRTRRASVADTMARASTPVDGNEPQTPIIARRARRASVVGSLASRTTPIDENEVQTVMKARRARRSSVVSVADEDLRVPLGKRLDRRSTLPNVAIPVNFAN